MSEESMDDLFDSLTKKEKKGEPEQQESKTQEPIQTVEATLAPQTPTPSEEAIKEQPASSGDIDTDFFETEVKTQETTPTPPIQQKAGEAVEEVTQELPKTPPTISTEEEYDDSDAEPSNLLA
ncbi:MAG: hypothetical protein ABIH76_01625 [Candidatus Bathyarchaeota archaeon]